VLGGRIPVNECHPITKGLIVLPGAVELVCGSARSLVDEGIERGVYAKLNERERRGHPLNLWTREHLHHLASPELLPTQHQFILGEEFEDGGDSVTLPFCTFSTNVSCILFYTKLFSKPNDSGL